jgi:predicted RND superfamily exporter protein
MPVLIFTKDHKAKTIARIVEGVKDFEINNTNKAVHFKLASGNVGVMAATNEAVDAAQFPMLLYVYTAIITLCLLTFRSLRATVCIVLPLGLVSALAYALMSILGIGLKVSTLPVVALGVGIGVDYGIYIFNRLHEQLDLGMSIRDAYEQTLNMTGNAVLFTGLTLGIGVFTWIFSDLQFQVDMGILLTFMFLLNMIAAITVLPALAALLYRKHK